VDGFDTSEAQAAFAFGFSAGGAAQEMTTHMRSASAVAILLNAIAALLFRM
jgi:hypothetical protein